jgi:hypothetical protein
MDTIEARTDAQRITDLEHQVALLAAKLEQYHDQACVIRALEDVTGYPMTTASYGHGTGRRPAARLRHLQAVR